MSIFTYVIVHDTGFAPNPYAGYLTLATCKPRIRRTAKAGDWVVGTGSARGVGTGRVVYAARVAEVIPIESYGREERFALKIPSVDMSEWARHGDNIYFSAGQVWRQRHNPHHNREHMERDLSGRNVLVAIEFWYFGQAAPPLPALLSQIVKTGPGHKRFDDSMLEAKLSRWLTTFPRGMSAQSGGKPKRATPNPCEAPGRQEQ